VLDQSTLAVTHEALGTFPLFLVPIGNDASGTRYQAAFA
jgi:hypothetical protein